MSDPYIGQIQATPYNFAPEHWAYCDGQSLLIQQYNGLFAVIGIAFGGDGRTNFNLPDLRGKAVMGSGQGPGLSNRLFGKAVGQTTVTLSSTQFPAHNHTFGADATQSLSSISPSNAYLAEGAMSGGGKGGPALKNLYTTTAPNTLLSPKSIASAGGSQAHENRQPYLVIPFCIALIGEFPVAD